jgi:hypothetical protein
VLLLLFSKGNFMSHYEEQMDQYNLKIEEEERKIILQEINSKLKKLTNTQLCKTKLIIDNLEVIHKFKGLFSLI